MSKVICLKCGWTEAYCIYPNNATSCYKCFTETKQFEKFTKVCI